MSGARGKVGEILTLTRRPVEVHLDESYEEIGIRSFGRGIFHKEPVSGAELGSKRVFRIEPGDLLLSNVFAWEGAVAVAGQKERGKIGSHRFMTYTPVDNRIDTNWASWFFRSEPGLELIRKASPGSAGRNRTLAIDRFEALEIPLPPPDEQRCIAANLDRIETAATAISLRRTRLATVAPAVPLSVRATLESDVRRVPTPLGDVLELVQKPVAIDPYEHYVTIGLRSFGKGVFHYPSRPGDQIGKLRFQDVLADLLVVSNIKAWEGAVATTGSAEAGTVASNRFLFFRPLAGTDAIDYFWALLLGPEGIGALGYASPGSADRNRTLAVDRFRQIKLPIPCPEDQLTIGRHIRAAREGTARFEARSESAAERIAALVPAALNSAFSGL